MAAKKRLTAKKKLEIYNRTRPEDAPVGEILREYGLHLSDLRKIEESIETWAIHGLKQKNNPNASKEVDPNDLKVLRKELEEKDRALADLTVEYMVLKKNDRLE